MSLGSKSLVCKAKKDAHKEPELTVNVLPNTQDTATLKPLEG